MMFANVLAPHSKRWVHAFTVLVIFIYSWDFSGVQVFQSELKYSIQHLM